MKIREGTKQDLPRVLELIKELAEYEKASHEVINTVEQLLKDGFGPNPIYGFFVTIISSRYRRLPFQVEYLQ